MNRLCLIFSLAVAGCQMSPEQLQAYYEAEGDRLEEATWQMSRIKPYLPGETEPEVPIAPGEGEGEEEAS